MARLKPRLQPLPDPADSSSPLSSVRHERFVQYCAAGIPPPKAYTSVGYSEKGAAQSAGQLLRKPRISSRLEYLRLQVIQAQTEGMKQAAANVVSDVVITKQRVIQRLDHLSRMAEADKRYGAAIRAEQLLGIEVGMFVSEMNHNVKWDGDLAKLDAAQLEKVKLYLEAQAYGDDTARLQSDKAAFLAARELRKAAEEAIQ